MGLISLAIPIGVALGIATWALIRGRGGLPGLLLCAFFSVVGALLGGFAASALFAGGSPATVGGGALVGALVLCAVEAVGFGPRPKRVARVDPKGVAVSQPDDGTAPKTLV
jgi:hypothetical protein